MIGKYLYEAVEQKVFKISSLSVVGFSTGAQIGSAIGQTIFLMSGNSTKLPRFSHLISMNSYRYINESQTCTSVLE